VILPCRPREEIRAGLSRGLSRTRMARRSFVYGCQAEQPSAVSAEAKRILVTGAGVAKVISLTVWLVSPSKMVGLRLLRTTEPSGCLRSSTMTETQHKTGPAWAEFSGDVLKSVETVSTTAIEAPCGAA
jgi:hypothetical protein